MAASADIDLRVPSVTEVRDGGWEPPSIYLFSAQYFLAFAGGREEYRAPFDATLLELDPTLFLAEFVSSRGEEGIASGWEFERVLWIHSSGIAIS